MRSYHGYYHSTNKIITMQTELKDGNLFTWLVKVIVSWYYIKKCVRYSGQIRFKYISKYRYMSKYFLYVSHTLKKPNHFLSHLYLQKVLRPCTSSERTRQECIFKMLEIFNTANMVRFACFYTYISTSRFYINYI